MNTKVNKKVPAVFYFGLALLFLFSLSSYFTGGLYARYTTGAVGEDSARVARFDISNTINETAPYNAAIDLNFYDPAKLTDTVQFLVESSSEVAVEYTVIVTMPDTTVDYDIWLDVSLITSTPEKFTITKSNNVYTIEGFDAMAPGVLTQAVHELQFKIRNPGAPSPELKNITNKAQITVHAQQID
jgi:hypothetical protein